MHEWWQGRFVVAEVMQGSQWKNFNISEFQTVSILVCREAESHNLNGF